MRTDKYPIFFLGYYLVARVMDQIPGLQEYTKELSCKEEEALAVFLFGDNNNARVNFYSLVTRTVNRGQGPKLEKRLLK